MNYDNYYSKCDQECDQTDKLPGHIEPFIKFSGREGRKSYCTPDPEYKSCKGCHFFYKTICKTSQQRNDEDYNNDEINPVQYNKFESVNVKNNLNYSK